MSAEPSMEDILSSIKRIIAEEGDAAVSPRMRRGARAQPIDDEDDDDGEVLELSDPMPAPPPAPPSTPPRAEPVRADPPIARTRTEAAVERPAPVPASAPARPADDRIVSSQTEQATRGALDVLSRLVVKPEPNGDGTLEGLVREMLRPMLRDWLDANLPPLVETMVAREIAKITGQSR